MSGNSKKSKIRVCGDYSVLVNPCLEPHRYPIPPRSDLLRKLSDGPYFTKIDLADAYNQILLSPDSQNRLALSTHRSVLLQQRLPFGILSAPGYFQEIMYKLTQDLPGVSVCMNDILISGVSPEDHLTNARKLFQRLKEKSLRCLEKCVFAQSPVEHLGFNLLKEGISKGHTVDAVINMPVFKNVSHLKPFLGQLQFYINFFKNLSTFIEPLFRLNRKNIPWQWGAEIETAFKRVKDFLCTDTVRTHFDQSLSVGISCDISNVGIGAVLFHRYPDGSKRPIANISKTLNLTQRNYCQIQK